MKSLLVELILPANFPVILPSQRSPLMVTTIDGAPQSRLLRQFNRANAMRSQRYGTFYSKSIGYRIIPLRRRDTIHKQLLIP